MDRQLQYKQLFLNLYQEQFKDLQVSQSQLLIFIQQISKAKYDQEIILEIWDRMDKVRDISSIDNFVQVFFEAEEVLMSKQQEANEILNQLNIQLGEIENLYQEAQEETQKTPQKSLFYGGEIQFQQRENKGRFSLTIKEVKDNLNGYQNAQYYISVQIGNEVQKTLSNNLLKWNQTITIFTNQEDDQLIISLCQDSKFISQPLGVIRVQLQQYRDQLMHNESMNFKDSSGKLLNKLLEFDVQWIFSATLFYEDKIKEWERRINEEELILQQISKDLIVLQNILHSLENMSGKNTQIQNSQPIFNQGLDSSSQFNKRILYFSFIYILICGIISFEQKAFLNICIIFCFTCDLIQQNLSQSRVFTYILLLILTVFADIYFFYKNDFDTFTKSTYFIDQNIEQNVKGLVYLCIVLMLMLKVVFGYLLNKIYKDLNQ